MRQYRVPFSTKEDEILVFNLSTKECMWFGAGIITSVVIAGIPALALHLPLTKIAYILPLAVPPIIMSIYMAKKKVKEFDKYVKVDQSIWNNYKYKKRCHDYYYFRR